MCYILYTAFLQYIIEENFIKEITRKRKYICSTVCVYWEKNPGISGPVWFKPLLFKGQLLQNDYYNKSN